MSDSLKIIFAGTPEFAARHLAAFLNSKHQIIGVLTQPDRPAGRGKKMTQSPVKVLALEHNIPLFQPESLCTNENQQQISMLNADLMVVVAYGLLLPENVLSMPRLGCINVHGSLLPRWRGAAPIQRALWAGDTETGVTIMQMDSGLDSGKILGKLACSIVSSDTSATLYHKLSELGPIAMLTAITQLANGSASAVVQDLTAVTYAHKLSKKEARLDWSFSAVQLERCIRAFNPWPVSFFMVGNNPVKVSRAQALPHQPGSQQGEILQADKSGCRVATSEGVLNITELQPAGKKMMGVREMLNSRREWLTPGTILS